MEAEAMTSGVVFDIQRHTTHDGPGIRTTVFFKGCNLRCRWCHNPESFHLDKDLELYPKRCITCGSCMAVCPNGSISFLEVPYPEMSSESLTVVKKPSVMITDRELCVSCGVCTEHCFAGARILVGKRYTTDEIMKVVIQDHAFYINSGGGVTCSGGEPFLQPEFLTGLLKALHDAGIHTAVDTAGNIPWEVIAGILPYIDLVLYDVKAFDESIHREATGVGNARILDNLKRLSKTEIPLWVRIPVIPGVNASNKEMTDIAEFLKTCGHVEKIELLPLHHLGSGKYESLGLPWPMADVNTPSDEDMAKWRKLFE